MEYEKIRRYADLAHIGRSDQMLATDFGRLRDATHEFNAAIGACKGDEALWQSNQINRQMRRATHSLEMARDRYLEDETYLTLREELEDVHAYMGRAHLEFKGTCTCQRNAAPERQTIGEVRNMRSYRREY